MVLVCPRVSNRSPGCNPKALSLWPGGLLWPHCVFWALCLHEWHTRAGRRDQVRVKYSSRQLSWELLPRRWLVLNVLQAWSCTRNCTVQSKSCYTLWFIVNIASCTSAQGLAGNAKSGTEEQASFGRGSLFSPIFLFSPPSSPPPFLFSSRDRLESDKVWKRRASSRRKKKKREFPSWRSRNESD